MKLGIKVFDNLLIYTNKFLWPSFKKYDLFKEY